MPTYVQKLSSSKPFAHRPPQPPRSSPRLKAFSSLAFLGGNGEKQESKGSRSGGEEGSGGGAAAANFTAEVEELKSRMEAIEAQLQQMNDRARERAVSLAQAVRSAGDGDSEAMEQLQHQQDVQLEQDQKAWDNVMDSFTQILSKGYIQSAEKIRDRLLIGEWELAQKRVAMRRGVSNFELYCASNKVPLPYELLTRLYEEPESLEIIDDEHLRMQARASINQAVDEEYMKVWTHTTSEAQKLAQQFSQSEFISKLIPENGLVEGLKKVIPMALKLVV